MLLGALDLINRQQADKEALIAGQETLQKYIAEQQAEIERLNKLLAEEETKYTKCAKRFYKEGVKELAERLKKEADYCYLGSIAELNYRISAKELGNLVKEMVGDAE